MLTRIQLFLAVCWFFVVRELRQALKPVRPMALAVMGLFMTCVPVLQPACTNPCVITMQVVDQGEALVPEAQNQLTQAAAVINALPDGAAKKTAVDAITKAAKGLHAAKETLKHARAICAAPNLAEVFRAFADGWTALKPYIGNTGGAGGYVPDPKAYEVGMGQ